MIPSILLVALFIGILIIIHEFGHLLVAKLSGINVEVFSVGFGPTLLKKVWSGTEYRLSLIPLGGFIKMAGENEPAAKVEQPAEAAPLVSGAGFSDKPLPVKVAVIAAGPVANLVLGFVLMSVMFGIFGIRYIAPVVDPAPNSPAAAAGLQSGDLVLTIDGDTVKSFEDIETRLGRSAGRELDFTVLRDGERLNLTVPVSTNERFDDERIPPVIGNVQPGSAADSAGLRPNDSIIMIADRPVEDWQVLVEVTRANPGRPVELVFQRDDSTRVSTVVPATVYDPEVADSVGQLGVLARPPRRDIEPWLPPVIGQVRSGGPADKAGISAGDTIIAVNDEPIERWEELLLIINRSPGDTLTVSWRQDGATRTESVVVASEKDQLTGRTIGQIGIWADLARHRLPVHIAVWEGASRSGFIVVQTFVIIWQVITRQIPSQAIGGPVFVAKVAYEGASWGAEYFIALWALLSINLFVVNLLPIPVLDGGRILLFVYEGARRRPLSERELVWAMNIGWAMIGLIFLLVLFNDIVRIFGS